MSHSGFCSACLIHLMFAEVENMAKLRIFGHLLLLAMFCLWLVVWSHDPLGLERICTIFESDEVNIVEI